MFLIDSEEELKELIRKVLNEEKYNNKDYLDYELVRIGHLALGYQTFIDREAKENEIEIYKWNEDFTSRWTIATFEYDEKEDFYILGSCGNRVNDIDDWEAFGELVKTGYNILDNLIYFLFVLVLANHSYHI